MIKQGRNKLVSKLNLPLLPEGTEALLFINFFFFLHLSVVDA